MQNEDENNFSNLGVLPDPRTDEQKARDWKNDELAGAVVIEWKKKPKSDWKEYTKRDQSSSSSCVAQSTAKAMEIIDQYINSDNLIYSAHPIYRSRVNFPEGGMYMPNAGEIAKKQGTALESVSQSQKLGETAMNRAIDVETPYKIFGYIPTVNHKSIDAIAEVIETHGHCILIFHSDRDEYLRNKPKYDPNGVVDIGHAICAVDYFIDDEGDKVILIEDSAGLSSTIDRSGRRLISEDFLKRRFSGAMYLIPKTPGSENKPTHTFTKPLKYGMKNDADVVALQNILKYEGIFPTTIPSTGNYLDVTAKAVLQFQRKYAVDSEQELARLGGRTVGPKTRAKLNDLYGNK